MVSFVCIQCIFGQIPSENNNSHFGWIQIQSNFPIQQIWIDSLEIKTANKYQIKLPIGLHVLQARAENSENWYMRDIVDTISVDLSDTLQIKISFPEYKMINTDPYGANVWSDDKLLGNSPFLITKEMLESDELYISKIGYKDTTLYKLEQSPSSIWIDLEVDSESKIHQKQISNLKLIRTNRQRDYALLTLGLGLVSGSTAYFFKKEADRKYDQYLHSGNPNEMSQLFDQTKTYDRLAAGTYIIFEVNLLASTYFFFRYLLNKE